MRKSFKPLFLSNKVAFDFCFTSINVLTSNAVRYSICSYHHTVVELNAVLYLPVNLVTYLYLTAVHKHYGAVLIKMVDKLNSALFEERFQMKQNNVDEFSIIFVFPAIITSIYAIKLLKFAPI